MDINHCNGSHFLTVIDCDPAQFAIWRRLPWQDTTSVINQLKALFYKWGPPTEILTDNDTAFRSSLLKTFLDEWRVWLRFRCAYIPSGNGITEWCHRSVKRIAARKRCTIPKAVYWYNVKGWRILCYSTSQYGLLVPLKGINETLAPTHNQQQAIFKPGDWVWVKTPHGRCTTKYKVGHVTGITSVQNITVNRMPRHVKDLWPIVGPGQPTVCSDMVSEDASKRFVTIRERCVNRHPAQVMPLLITLLMKTKWLYCHEDAHGTKDHLPNVSCVRIRGECSSNATNNLTSKKLKVCSLCYQHAETRRRKGRKRCDLFYGGEWDKPPWSGEIWWT